MDELVAMHYVQQNSVFREPKAPEPNWLSDEPNCIRPAGVAMSVDDPGNELIILYLRCSGGLSSAPNRPGLRRTA